MSFTDFAAVIGALAWIPPIFASLRAWLTKPKVRVITQPVPEVGYTALGPIINFRVAFTATHKDIVITGIRLRATHDSGQQVLFSWRGIVQRMGTMTFPEVGALPFEKESDVLALKVALKDVEERFIRFQNQDFLQKKAALEASSIKKLNFLRQNEGFDEQVFLRSQEMSEIYSHFRQSFSWKPGTYRLTVLIESPDAFDVVDDEYTFSLSPIQITDLNSNLHHIEKYYSNEIVPLKEGEQIKQIVWKWSYPDMQRVDGPAVGSLKKDHPTYSSS